MVRCGVSLEQVRQILGHVAFANTALYVALDHEELWRTVGLFPALSA